MPSGSNDSIAQFKELCKTAGLKITHQRLEVFRELLAAEDHPSAETLYKRLERKLPTLSLDTVYRTLSTFVELGLVQRIETLDNQARFEVRGSKHHHFFCNQCGKVHDFYWQSFDGLNIPEHVRRLGEVTAVNAVLHGLCRSCTEAQKR